MVNSPFTKATDTLGAGGIGEYVKKKFKVEVMFITSSKVICRVVDGVKKKEKFTKKNLCKAVNFTMQSTRQEEEEV